jgi:hypothetical protein
MKFRGMSIFLILLLLSTSVHAMSSPPTAESTDEKTEQQDVGSAKYPFSISIDNPSINIVSDPASTQNGEINVQNNGMKTLKIKAYVADWTYSKDGSKVFYPGGSTKNSCADWIHVTPANLSLKPLETEQVKYIITTPKNAAGGHVAVLFFESVFEEKGDILVGGRIGSIIYQETKGKVNSTGEIKKFSAEAVKDKKGAVNFKLVFVNTGNSHIAEVPAIKVFSKDGGQAGEFNMPDIKTLPGDEVNVAKEFVFDEKELSSEHKAVVSVKLDDKTTEKSINFTPKNLSK